MESKLLTVTEVQNRLGLSRQTIWRMTKEGKLRAVKIGKLVRYEASEIETFIANLFLVEAQS